MLEVLIALTLVASAMLGAAAAQWAALRSGDAQTYREQASWIAASVAEGQSFAQRPSSLLDAAQARAGAVLPRGQVSIVDQARGGGTVVVAWAHGRGSVEHGRTAGHASCPPAGEGVFPRCIALPLGSR